MTSRRAITLLERLRADGEAIGTREQLAVAVAVAALAPDDEALSAMVASLVAHNQDDWDRVQRRCGELLLGIPADEGRGEEGATTGAQASLVPDAQIPAPQTPWRRAGLTVPRNRRRRSSAQPRDPQTPWRWVGLAVVGLIVAGMIVGALLGAEEEAPTAVVNTATAPTTQPEPGPNTAPPPTTQPELGPNTAPPPTTQPAPAPEPKPKPKPTPAPDPEPAPRPTLINVAPARPTDHTLSEAFDTPARSPAITGLSLALLALGLTLFFAPGVRSARIRDEIARSRARADALLLAGRRGDLALYIPRAPLLRPAAIDAAAGWLGRRNEETTSPHLHVAATVEAAARRPGPVVPCYLPAVGGPPLLVWVDVEYGDHPLAWAVEAVLDRWTRQGLRFERLNYNRDPTLLTDPRSRRDWTIDALSRRTAGAPLLLLSRLDDPHEYEGTLGWLGALTPWPRRALIDLNPLPDQARGVGELARRLHQARLPRLAFTEDGLVAAAALLATGERRGAPPPPPNLPSVEALREPLARWLVCACCVPQPTWAQLEAIRRALFAETLPDPRLVQHLLAAYRDDDGAEPISSDGRTLLLPPAKVAKVLAADRRLHGGPSPLQQATLRLLIEQLDRAKPEAGTLAEWRKHLRIACYELTLDERTVEQVLAEFADSPVRDELERRLAQEHRVRLEVGPDDDGPLGKIVSADGPLSLGEVFTLWGRVGGGQRLAGALALVVLAFGVWWLGTPGEIVSVTRRVELPEEWEVVVPEVKEPEPSVAAPPTPEPVVTPLKTPMPDPIVAARAPEAVASTPTPEPTPRGPLRPTLVSIPGGTFRMGSPKEALTWAGDRKANEDELPQRELMIPAFQMCKTEVTQAQYQAVMGTNPSDCRFGCGAGLPVQNVSWVDAVAYLNTLTALESEARVTEGKSALSACYEGSDVNSRWVSGCTGYRLPTEAEWEYAARAGTTTWWSFGDDPTFIGGYAWYGDNAGGKVHAVGGKRANPWGLHDLHGNVWEWVWDAYDAYDAYNRDIVVNSQGTYRALRGGSVDDSPGYLRSALRYWSSPVDRLRVGGFRCARGAGPQR